MALFLCFVVVKSPAGTVRPAADAEEADLPEPDVVAYGNPDRTVAEAIAARTGDVRSGLLMGRAQPRPVDRGAVVGSCSLPWPQKSPVTAHPGRPAYSGSQLLKFHFSHFKQFARIRARQFF